MILLKLILSFKEKFKKKERQTKQAQNLKRPDPLNVVLDLLFNLFWHALSHLVLVGFLIYYFFGRFSHLDFEL